LAAAFLGFCAIACPKQNTSATVVSADLRKSVFKFLFRESKKLCSILFIMQCLFVFWFISFFTKVVKLTFSAYQKNLNFKKKEGVENRLESLLYTDLSPTLKVINYSLLRISIFYGCLMC
jgi:hypothetical protein